MAVISLNKLAVQKAVAPIDTEINGVVVTVKQYLPVSEKSKIIEQVLAAVIDNNGFASPVRQEIYSSLYIIKYYTNISITDKMIEAADKTYDTLIMNDIVNQVFKAIPQDELDNLIELIQDSINVVVDFNTSLLGMVRTISQDYDKTSMDLSEVMKTLDQPDKVGLVKDVMEKLG